MAGNAASQLSLRRFLRSESGNIAIITALMLPVLAGFLGLAVETSYWYYRHTNVQDAADIAAYGGAVVLARGGNERDVTAAAKADAITNGWRHSSGGIRVRQQGPFVEVQLTENPQRYFSRLVCGSPTIKISARSVAVGIRGHDRVRLLFINDSEKSKQNAKDSVTRC
jgi:Flp pilus assembly protein TadG